MSSWDRVGVLGRFAALLLVCFVGLGVALAGLVVRQVRSDAVAHDAVTSRHLSRVLADASGSGGQLNARVVEDFLRMDHDGDRYVAVRIWDRGLRLISETGGGDPPSAAVRRARFRALDGRATEHHDDAGALRHYVVPVTPHGVDGPVGVLEVVKKTDVVDAGTTGLMTRLTLLLGGGLLVLYLLVFRLARSVTRGLRTQAMTDALTGLANRRAVERELDRRGVDPTGLVLLDLDDFKAVNTLHGFARGDDLLRDAAERLRVVIPRGGMLGRLGGDEFAIVVPGGDPVAVRDVAERAAAALAEQSAASAGLACAPADATTVRDLLGPASAALATAKRARGGVCAYVPGQEVLVASLAHQRREIEEVLGDPDALSTVFQPIISLVTGEVALYEALARFAAPTGRPPNEWFDQAHRVGLGVELEIRAATGAIDAARRLGLPAVSVNASPSAVGARKFLDALPTELGHVTIELTEHDRADVEPLREAMAELRSRGAKIAIDDAGAGYAGLQQIVALDPDLIKLDRDLVRGIDQSRTKVSLLDAFVRFARRSGATLCAEGIETLDELRTVADLDVALGQGYAIARPGAPGAVDPAAVATCRSALEEALTSAPARAADDAHELERLEDIGARFAAARRLDDLPTVTPLVCECLHADAVALSLYEHETQDVVTLRDDAWRKTAERFSLSQYPATRRVLEERIALQVLAGDPSADGAEVDYLRTIPYRSVLLVPIVFGDTAVGLLEAYARDERPWTRTEILRARVVCHHLASVVLALDATGAVVRRAA